MAITQDLQRSLTELGLVRILAREDVTPALLREGSLEDAARAIEHSILAPGFVREPITTTKALKPRFVKKAKKSAKKGASRADTGPRKVGTARVRSRPAKYWERVQRELHLLICTNDSKYESLRRAISKHGSLTQTTIVSNISSAIAVSLGYTLAAITPLVAIGLIAFLRVGANAWCAGRV
jgi:hypothetical protein